MPGKIDCAPMEGVTRAVFRRRHHELFGGIDRYFTPFLAPSADGVFSEKELREVRPEACAGVPTVPQLLAGRAEHFLWAAKLMAQMGYDEVNLNVGCPSATVVTKGKGSGLLKNPDVLNEFLYEIFRKARGSISVKTRLGMTDPEEFHRILSIYSRYPISLLIIHPRTRMDYYKEPIRMAYFEQAMADYKGELCFNGGIVSPAGFDCFTAAHPGIDRVMMGMGLLADPALALKIKGTGTLTREALRGFHDQLYYGYLDTFHSEKNAVFHMKELWLFLQRNFDEGEKLFKQIKKAQNAAAYEPAVEELFRSLPLRKSANWE